MVSGDFVQAQVDGLTMPLSGVAPHASIIAYDRFCDPTDLCASDGAVKQSDQAIQDQANHQECGYD